MKKKKEKRGSTSVFFVFFLDVFTHAFWLKTVITVNESCVCVYYLYDVSLIIQGACKSDNVCHCKSLEMYQILNEIAY